MAETDRGASPSGETPIIGLFLAVAAGAITIALVQAETIMDLIGYSAFRIFVTLMAAALLAALWGAYFKYRHKFWDRVADEEPAIRRRYARRNLRSVHVSVVAALVCIALGIVTLVVALWLSNPPEDDDRDYHTTQVMKI